MDVDEVLKRIGGFGPAQNRIYFLIAAMHVFGFGLQGLTVVFVGEEPAWTCGGHEELEPEGTGTPCQRFEAGTCTPSYQPNFTSIVTEWDLVCSSSYLSKLSQSLFFLGCLVGSWVFGYAADVFGRKAVLYVTGVLLVVLGVCNAAAPSLGWYLLTRTLLGLPLQGIALVAFVLHVEWIGPDDRSIPGIMYSGFFAFGFSFLALFAYFIRHWRTLLLFISLLGLGCLLMTRLLPESPRWLIVQGRDTEARRLLAEAARRNGTTMPDGDLKVPLKTTNGGVSTLDLFRGRHIRSRMLVLMCSWFTNCLVYYSLSLAAGQLGGNHYLSFSLSGLIEIPSYVAMCYTITTHRFGRKLSHSGTLLLAGVSCLLCSVLSMAGGSTMLITLAALMGKFAISASFSVAYLFSAELFPTQGRNLAMGLLSLVSRMGGIISPLTLILDHNTRYLLMGSLAVGVGLASLTLPETLNKNLPETLHELDPQTQHVAPRNNPHAQPTS